MDSAGNLHKRNVTNPSSPHLDLGSGRRQRYPYPVSLMNMKKLEETLREPYGKGEKDALEATLSAAKDALESYGGRSADIGAVVGVLLDALERQVDADVVEWTLEALVGATYHPNFASLDLTRLVKFLEGGSSEWLATGLEVLAGTSDSGYTAFVAALTGHPDPKIAANAIDALAEIHRRGASPG